MTRGHLRLTSSGDKSEIHLKQIFAMTLLPSEPPRRPKNIEVGLSARHPLLPESSDHIHYHGAIGKSRVQLSSSSGLFASLLFMFGILPAAIYDGGDPTVDAPLLCSGNDTALGKKRCISCRCRPRCRIWSPASARSE